ncbi:MAG TPA: Yip1 family protein [Pyrinomonadaceae bacterium]|nr:Yip1 family protein [Pyrinomonadaceae bacterium]
MSEPSHTTPAPAGPAAMSTPQTLSSIFFEPSETFTALRERPRFLVVGLILVALTMLVTVLILQRVDFENFMREQVERSPRAEQMSPEQKEQVIAMQSGPVGKAITYGAILVGSVVAICGGAALYLLGVMLIGGKMSYRQALSVWVYSSFPPAVLATVVSIVTIFLKSPEDIDPRKPGGGVTQSNLGLLLGPDSSPALAALLGSFDLFAFYGLFLAAVGLRRVGRISSGSAWAVVIGLWVIFVLVRVGWAATFGG